MRKASSIIITITLGLVLLILLFIGFHLLTSGNSRDPLKDATNENASEPFDNAETSYTIEVTEPKVGDVVKLYGYRFRVPGSLYEVPNESAVTFNYMSNETGDNMTVHVYTGNDMEGILTALDDYFYGDILNLMTYFPVSVLEENLDCYEQVTPEGSIAIIYNDGNQKYYMFVPISEMYLLIESDEMIYMTESAETVVFSNPADDPMTEHTYSMYEVTAIENTRNQLTDGATAGSTADLRTDVPTGGVSYTSEADDETRKEILNYESFKWNPDGTSDNTSASLDVNSTTAKASEWVLASQSAYSFTDNGLRLHTLRATRNNESFSVEGKVTNQLPTDRPYVLCVKFLNSQHELLGVGVVDKRPEPISGNGVAEWSYILKTDSGIDLQDIYALQFYMY